mmetsp:Transcript_15067/g.23383  ORF Transcript_15067/g.23383 Transcript_15067/m.23383 type:complete len:545 (-) Transcript_15067:134-1768(-)|eukprot:CAMPEP_0196827320 /NCGR_PEP_ID=MMETSP1362-20130617/94093_1 /TAXON_ID=163516 /ORGANISM="Leptocylindrus danicus, Strain CCMP1856" /LENGTH=544 /DNA_ID=CAMNT_0042207949 /DNA_START=1583 /DNA_END=3214 /DNA_ORIENTATION=-
MMTPYLQIMLSLLSTPLHQHQIRGVTKSAVILQRRRLLEVSKIASTTSSTRRYSSTSNYSSEQAEAQDQFTLSGYKRPTVNWYPGHIAKAERLLSETLRSVDVVLEVRDARAPKATAHPRVGEWAAGKPRIVVLTKGDLVPGISRGQWRRSYEELGAANWDQEIAGDVKNQALQVIQERQKYEDGSTYRTGRTIEKNKRNGNNHGNGKGGKKQQFSQVDAVMFINAKHGEGVHGLNRAILKSGAHINERRRRRGLSDRPLRVGVIGYPNVGKSALINKILGRKRAKSHNTPGVTRALQWIRVTTSETGSNDANKMFELLDSPGVIPSNLEDQSDALLLAAVNSIGEAAYDNQAVAAYLMEWIKTLHVIGKEQVTAPQWREKVKERYKFDPMLPLKDQPLLHSYLNEDDEDFEEQANRLLTGEDMLFMVADNTCMGDPENASRKILQDFRNGRVGPVALQLAPDSESDEGQKKVPLTPDLMREGALNVHSLSLEDMAADEKDTKASIAERANAAKEVAKEKGLELPPMVTDTDEDNVGRGMFEGW